MTSAAATKTIGQINAEYDAWRDRQEIKTSCAVEACDWEFIGPAGDAREEAARHRESVHPELRPRSRDQINQERKTAEKSAAVRRREQQTLARGSSTVTPTPPAVSPRKKGAHWTVEQAIAGVRAKAAELGHPPSVAEARGDPRIPSQPTATTLCGGWARLIELAGFPKPTRRTRYTEPIAPLDVQAAPPPEAAPEPSSEGSRGSEPHVPVDLEVLTASIVETVLAVVRAEHERQAARLATALRRLAAGVLETIESLDSEET